MRQCALVWSKHEHVGVLGNHLGRGFQGKVHHSVQGSAQTRKIHVHGVSTRRTDRRRGHCRGPDVDDEFTPQDGPLLSARWYALESLWPCTCAVRSVLPLTHCWVLLTADYDKITLVIKHPAESSSLSWLAHAGKAFQPFEIVSPGQDLVISLLTS